MDIHKSFNNMVSALFLVFPWMINKEIDPKVENDDLSSEEMKGFLSELKNEIPVDEAMSFAEMLNDLCFHVIIVPARKVMNGSDRIYTFSAGSSVVIFGIWTCKMKVRTLFVLRHLVQGSCLGGRKGVSSVCVYIVAATI